MSKLEERKRPAQSHDAHPRDAPAGRATTRGAFVARPSGRIVLSVALVSFVAVGLVIGLGLVQRSSPPMPPPVPDAPAPGPWSLKLNATFTGDSLNTALWTPGWFGTGISGPMKDACVAASNAVQTGGVLQLRLERRTSTCSGKSRPWLGSLVSTNPNDGVAGHEGFQFTYGYAQAKIKFLGTPTGGIADWPAWWINGQNWPVDGEIDIAEGLFGRACVHFHYLGGVAGRCVPGSWADRWNTYGVNWEPGSITWYYDGVKVGETTQHVTSSPMYLLLDNVQGKHGGDTVAPSRMLVDYVRVWQHS